MNTNWLNNLKELSLKPRSNSVKTFKSYIDLETGNTNKQNDSAKSLSDSEEYTKEASDSSFNEVPDPVPTLLPGELVISQAENILKFNTLSDLNKGISGLLLCTNFKLSFLTAETFPSTLHQKNHLLGENEVCLINISHVYNVVGGKRKKITSTSPVANIEIIEIHCKDFCIFTFSFKFSPVSQRSVISTIVHHAFPPKINLLFAFEYKGDALCSSLDSNQPENHSLLFTRPSDWEAEIKRCDCPGWRVTLANEKFLLCESLPECFVVPSVLLDMNLNKSAPHFKDHRVAIWSWGLPSGASIVRMAAKDPGISDNRQKDVIIDAISRTSPRKLPVQIYNLDDLCPSYKDVQTSFLKLKDLCMPNSPSEFWESDNNYYINLEATKWLHYVCSCLKVAVEAAQCLQENKNVVLCEHEGRDLSAVLSSLIQLILDPTSRTTHGFEILIQKEWVALGHPFTLRHHLIKGAESEEAPVFLLFLDCVWQFSEQCPCVFEFSETYLTTLWDSCHMSLFDTFLFNSHKSRIEALFTQNCHFSLRSVWNWSFQFSNNNLRLFCNPFYILNKYANRTTNKPHDGARPKSVGCIREARKRVRKQDKKLQIVWDDKEENLLYIDPNIKSLKLWHQCYMRWNPLDQILGGGPPVIFLSNLKVSSEIEALENKIKTLNAQLSKESQDMPTVRHRRVASDDYTISADIMESVSGHGSSSVISSVFPFAPVAPWDLPTTYSVPSSSCLQISYTESEDNLDD